MLTLRYISNLTYAYLARFKLIIAISVLLGLASFFILGKLLPQFLFVDNERIGVSGRYRIDTLPEWLTSQIGEGLTKINEDGTVVAGLSDNWRIEDEGKRWIFHIDQNKKWQDGEKIKSTELVYQFDDVKVSYPDEETIEFELKEAFAPFGAILAKPVFRQGLLGSGQWRATDLNFISGVVQKVVIKNGEGQLKTYKFYPTQEKSRLAFKLGEIDMLVDLVDAAPFDTWKTTTIKEEIAKDRVLTVFFNSRDSLLSSKPLRQALSYAINKENFRGKRALSSINNSSWAFNSQVKPYDYDIERAKELVSDITEETKESSEIKLVTNPLLLDIAEKIAEDWRALGFKVNVQITSSFPEEYSAFLAIYEIPKDPDQYFLWHSTQFATNISKYSNQRIDKLLEDGRQELDEAERKRIYLDFQRFLLEDAPAAFLVHPVSYSVVRK